MILTYATLSRVLVRELWLVPSDTNVIRSAFLREVCAQCILLLRFDNRELIWSPEFITELLDCKICILRCRCYRIDFREETSVCELLSASIAI
jgi:hypothetical protein